MLRERCYSEDSSCRTEEHDERFKQEAGKEMKAFFGLPVSEASPLGLLSTGRKGNLTKGRANLLRLTATKDVLKRDLKLGQKRRTHLSLPAEFPYGINRILVETVDGHVFLIRVDNPEFLNAHSCVGPFLVHQIQLSGLGRQDFYNQIRCPFGACVRQDSARCPDESDLGRAPCKDLLRSADSAGHFPASFYIPPPSGVARKGGQSSSLNVPSVRTNHNPSMRNDQRSAT